MSITLAVLLLVIPASMRSVPQEGDEVDVVEQIVARYVTAIGGREKLLARRSMTQTVSVTLFNGSTAKVVQEYQRPDKFRAGLTTEGGVATYQSFDGENGWSLSPVQPEVVKLGAEEAWLLEREADMEGPLVDWRSKGHRIELVGREDLDGRPVDHLRVHRRGALPDEEEHHYLDAETALPVKVVVQYTFAGLLSRSEKSLADYRLVDGILIPHQITDRQGTGGEWVSTHVVESVEFGGELEDGRFRLEGVEVPVRERIPPLRIDNDPAARTLYDGMIAAMREADSLSFTSRYSMDMDGLAHIECSYEIWLKKANRYRMEAFKADGTLSGVLVGDGQMSWTYWPNGRPVLAPDEDPDEPRTDVYMAKPSPTGHHSIGHDAAMLGAGMVMTVFDASTFHGYTDSLQPLIDAVGGARTESFGEEECDVVQVSFMDGQRSWELWISRRDHLPRKLREIVRVHVDLIVEETWTDVEVDGEIPDEQFRWRPPEGWTEWRRPESESKLLAVGTPAPDFELELAGGGTQRLSDLRGEVVMLVFWRSG